MKRGYFTLTGQHISVLYDWYCKDLLKVNRDYQRRLVWSLKEKSALIDTVIKGYPLPLFLLASDKPDDNGAIKEVIDGLQRLEAFFAFIDNKYAIPYNGSFYYFDRDCIPGYGALIREGKLEQKTPVLPLDVCRNFMQYQIPVSIVGSGTVNIEDVFKRINSTGRKLSKQNLRQAGVTGRFSRLVQNIASKIRNENLPGNPVPFQTMETISLSGRGLSYGVDVNRLFWIQHDIINDGAIRRAKDEEIIANIANYLLTGVEVQMSATALDNVYDSESLEFSLVEEKLADDRLYRELEHIILDTFQDIKTLLESSGKNFTQLICSHRDTASKDIMFIVIFLALAELRRESYTINDYKKTAAELEGIADTEFCALISDRNKRRDTNYRNTLITNLKTRFKKHAKFSQHNPEWDREVADLLAKAKSESSYFDFKLTTWNYRENKDNMKSVIRDCVLTLTAMANTHPHENVQVIIGVADSEHDANAFVAYHNRDCLQCNDYYIAGIEDDAKAHHLSVNRFAEAIRQKVSDVKEVSEVVKNNILGSMSEMHFEDRTLYVLRYKTDNAVLWDNNYYVRRADANHKLAIGEYEDMIKKFYNG